jgi:hypothetical protein
MPYQSQLNDIVYPDETGSLCVLQYRIAFTNRIRDRGRRLHSSRQSLRGLANHDRWLDLRRRDLAQGEKTWASSTAY